MIRPILLRNNLFQFAIKPFFMKKHILLLLTGTIIMVFSLAILASLMNGLSILKKQNKVLATQTTLVPDPPDDGGGDDDPPDPPK